MPAAADPTSTGATATTGSAHASAASAADLAASIPTAHLQRPPEGASGVVLLLPGSLSPPTTSHTRLLSAARAALQQSALEKPRTSTDVDAARDWTDRLFVAGALISPAPDAYVHDAPQRQAKGGGPLLPARARVAMCRAAVAHLPWADVMTWETGAARAVRTAEVVAAVRAATTAAWGEAAGRVRVVLVAGSDLVAGMTDTARWPTECVVWLRDETDGVVVAPRFEAADAGADGDDETRQRRGREMVVRLGWDARYVWSVSARDVGGVSSTLVRARAVAGLDVDGLVAPGVAELLRAEYEGMEQAGK